MWPLAVSPNRTAACSSESTCPRFTTLSRSQRSAAAPAIAPSSRTGKKSANATMPSQSSRVRQLPGEPANPDPLHPRADQRDAVSRRIEAVVGVAQREREPRARRRLHRVVVRGALPGTGGRNFLPGQMGVADLVTTRKCGAQARISHTGCACAGSRSRQGRSRAQFDVVHWASAATHPVGFFNRPFGLPFGGQLRRRKSRADSAWRPMEKCGLSRRRIGR